MGGHTRAPARAVVRGGGGYASQRRGRPRSIEGGAVGAVANGGVGTLVRWGTAVVAAREQNRSSGESGHVPVPVHRSVEGGVGWGAGECDARKGQGGSQAGT